MTTTQDIPYRTVDGHTLEARLYRPDQGGNGKWVVDVHGGAWGSGDRLNNQAIHEDLAAHGIGVCALDFRLSDVAQYPAPAQDVSFGIRWFKASLTALGITEVTSIGGLAASSGAQQLGLAAFAPGPGTAWHVEDADLGDTDSSVDFFVACWPILDPLRRYRMVKEAGNERLIAAHDAYFASEADMETGNPFLLLQRGAATHFPPMAVMQGTEDANVDHTWQDEFAELYRKHGSIVDMHKFDGQPHTFVTADPDTEASKAAIAKIRDFVLGV